MKNRITRQEPVKRKIRVIAFRVSGHYYGHAASSLKTANSKKLYNSYENVLQWSFIQYIFNIILYKDKYICKINYQKFNVWISHICRLDICISIL